MGTFRGVNDVQSTVSTVLGSMTPETSCVCHFYWHLHPERAPRFSSVLASSSNPEVALAAAQEMELEHRRLAEQELEQGMRAIQRKNSEAKQRAQAFYDHTTHWNSGFRRDGTE